MAMLGFKKLIEKALPGTIDELVKKSGCAESTIRRWLRRMRKSKECHIGKWVERCSCDTPYWVEGKGDDAPYVRLACTSAEYSKRWRDGKKRVDYKLMCELKLARAKARKNADIMAKRGDPLVNVFFGRAA